MSKEDLIELVKSIKKEDNEIIETIQGKLNKANKENEKLRAQMRKIQIELEKEIAKYEKLLNEYKLSAYNKYVKQTEQTELLVRDGIVLEEETINEVEAKLEKKERKPRKKQAEQFVKELKNIVTKTIVEDYDFEGNNVDKNKVKKFGEDRSKKVEVSYKFDVVEIVRPKYKDKENIYQARNNDVFPHSILTPSFAANIINFKYRLHIPLYRYSDLLKAHGLNISESNLCNYVSRISDKLEVVYCEIKKELLRSNVIHIDETTLEVLDVKEKDKCYMFVYSSGNWTTKQVCLYEFNESRKTDKVNIMLKDYTNKVICDGYNGYDFLEKKGIKIQRCWVHIRRYFVDCYKILRESEKYKHPAYKIVHLIDKIFKEESKYKEGTYTQEQIKEARNSKKYKEILENIDNMIAEENEKEVISENLRKAINYYINIKEKGQLYTFLEDGEMEIDNNLAERTVKPFVIGRKNFSFCKTSNSAEITSKLYSIIQTALKNGIEVESYIKYVLENIESKKVEELLPWNENIKDKFSISNIKIKNPDSSEANSF